MSFFSRFGKWVRDGLEEDLSLDPAFLKEALEKEFGIVFPEDPGFEILTVGDLNALVIRLLRETGQIAEDSEVWPRVQNAISQCQDLAVEKIARHTTLKELGY